MPNVQQTEQQKQIGNYWSKQSQKPRRTQTRWWQIPDVIRYINKRVSGESVDGFSQGLTNTAIKLAGNKAPFLKGVSVGCGAGAKEMSLIKAGLVEQFDLFDLSAERIKQGKDIAQKLSLADRVNFYCTDAFQTAISPSTYDFVHWNNSLHHMPNVVEAVSWSYYVLQTGGMFYMDDYIGANRFQWSSQEVEIASKARENLPKQYLLHSQSEDRCLPTKILVPNREALIAQDPSEAGDSERIIEAVRLFFQEAKITFTGGIIYHLALSDVFQNFNFDNEGDVKLLSALLLLDEIVSDFGFNHYATALAIK
ncbi:class I SAM-dependent methyltransferase [Microcoleus sp. N9_A1]|uniref:class I SAM-dependent methyltransferase n=1 Tax=Microcoleus sp. N9_A1 TaxID=3055380 RepID=UPI002FCF968E